MFFNTVVRKISARPSHEKDEKRPWKILSGSESRSANHTKAGRLWHVQMKLDLLE